MNTVTKFAAVAALALSAAAFAGGAQALTFANFTQIGQARTVSWQRAGSTGAAALNASLFTTANGTTPGGIGIRFNFLQPSLATDFQNLNAILTLKATENGVPAQFSGAPFNGVLQTNIDGNTPTTGFSIIYSGPSFMHGIQMVNSGANLLSGKFSNIWLSGVKLANAGNAADSDPAPGTVTYTSDFINFTNTSERGFSFDLTSVNPTFGYQAGKALPSFKASVAGSFSSTSVPEPATWGLMIMGLGGVGVMLRRRRHGVAFA